MLCCLGRSGRSTEVARYNRSRRSAAKAKVSSSTLDSGVLRTARSTPTRSISATRSTGVMPSRTSTPKNPSTDPNPDLPKNVAAASLDSEFTQRSMTMVPPRIGGHRGAYRRALGGNHKAGHYKATPPRNLSLMPIAITAEHQDLADSVRSLVARTVLPEMLHQAMETPIATPPPYWQAAADQGLHGVHLAESVGGQGFGILELAVVLAEFGRGAVPGPFVPSTIASALISAHDPDSKLLGDLASGATIAVYALESSLTATRRGDVLVVRGEVRSVAAAAQATLLVLPVSTDIGTVWTVLDAGQLDVEQVVSVDPLRPVAHVRAGEVEVGEDRVLSNLSVDAAQAIVSTLLSAEAIGVARWATDTASAYAKIREQFGRPIGQFQAIKHKCAEMMARTERATAAVWDAARAIGEGIEKPRIRSTIRCCRGGDASSGRCPELHPRLHPGAWRHRLHLGARHGHLLPSGARARRGVRPRRRLSPAGRRHRDYHRRAQARPRPRPRD